MSDELTLEKLKIDERLRDVLNLITLCRKCNVKVNFDRNLWSFYFKNLLGNRGILS